MKIMFEFGIFFRYKTTVNQYYSGLTQIEQKKEILDLKNHYFSILTSKSPLSRDF